MSWWRAKTPYLKMACPFPTLSSPPSKIGPCVPLPLLHARLALPPFVIRRVWASLS